MPRSFFHVADGQDFPDLQGSELTGLDAARREALRFTGALLSEAHSHFWSGEEWMMRVTDEHDLTLFSIMLVATNAAAVAGRPVETERRDNTALVS